MDGTRVYNKFFSFHTMPAAGAGFVGHLSQIGNGRPIGEPGRAVTFTLDNRDSTLHGGLDFQAAGVLSGGLRAAGPAFAAVAGVANYLDLFTSNVAPAGGLNFFVAGDRAKGWKVTASNGDLKTGGPGVHITQSAANGDLASLVTFAAATSGVKTFARAFNSPPHCDVTPLFDVGSGVRFWYTRTASAVTVHTSSAVTGDFTVTCTGNPD